MKSRDTQACFPERRIMSINIRNNQNQKKIDIFLITVMSALVIGFIIVNLIRGDIIKPGRTVLTVSGQWENIFDANTFNELVSEYGKQNPKIKIIQSAAESAQPISSDIIFMNDSTLCSLIQAKKLLPLNTFIENDSDETQWAIPLKESFDLLFYNIDLLKSAGFERPPKNRNEYLKYAKAVSAGQNSSVRGAALALSQEDPYAIPREVFSWLWSAGFSVIKDNKPQIDKKALSELFDFLKQLAESEKSEKEFLNRTINQQIEEFSQGSLALMIAPVQTISVLTAKNLNFGFGITVIPGTAVPGNNKLGLSASYTGISGTCKHKEEAWQFLSFLEEKSRSISLMIDKQSGHVHGFFPKNRSDGTNQTENALYDKVMDILESSVFAETLYTHPLASELDQIVREELINCIIELTGASSAADLLQKRWFSVLERF